MTAKHRTVALILKKNDRNESDRVFSVFTKDYGRIEILGKAIRKINSKLGRGIDLASLSEVEFIQGKNGKTLTDSQKKENFYNITQSPEKFLFFRSVSEILDNFIKGEEKDERVFNLINETFANLNSCPERSLPCSMAYYYFVWNFLSLQGYHPELYKCAVCHERLNPYSVYFSSKEGGAVCSKCLSHDKNALKINSDAVKILRIIFQKDWQTLLKIRVEESSQKILGDLSQKTLTALCPSSV